MQVFQRVGQAMYEQQQAQSAPDAGAPGDQAGGAAAEPESEDDVVEGEIVDEGGA
jgi:hypothetical protein